MTREELKEVLADAYEYSQVFESTSGRQGKLLVDKCIDLLIAELEALQNNFSEEYKRGWKDRDAQSDLENKEKQ